MSGITTLKEDPSDVCVRLDAYVSRQVGCPYFSSTTFGGFLHVTVMT
jgi:hypothetical protein